RRGGRPRREENAAERKQVFAAAVGQPTEVTNARETLGENVLHETAQELFAGKGHGALLAVMRVVLPSEGYMGVADVEKAVVGNRHPMGIAGQILQDMFGPAERGLGVDHPILLKQSTQKRRESLWVGQGKAFSVEGQSASTSSTAQAVDELPTKHPTEHLDRQEEVDARGDPALVIGRQSSSRHDAVQVGVRLQGLSPGVQDAEKSDLRTEMFGIGSHFQQGGRRGLEQQGE